jgi:hypothetical protein
MAPDLSALRRTLDSDARARGIWEPILPRRDATFLAKGPQPFLERMEEQTARLAEDHEYTLQEMLDGVAVGLSALELSDHAPPKTSSLAAADVLLAATRGYARGLASRLGRVEREFAEIAPLDPVSRLLRPAETRDLLSLEMVRCQRMELPLGAVALVSSDGDPVAGGSAAGLLDIAQVLRRNLRRYDGIGLLESGDLLLVLPDIARGGVQSVAERLHARLSEASGPPAGRLRFALSHLDAVDVAAHEFLGDIVSAARAVRAAADYIVWI